MTYMLYLEIPLLRLNSEHRSVLISMGMKSDIKYNEEWFSRSSKWFNKGLFNSCTIWVYGAH